MLKISSFMKLSHITSSNKMAIFLQFLKRLYQPLLFIISCVKVFRKSSFSFFASCEPTTMALNFYMCIILILKSKEHKKRSKKPSYQIFQWVLYFKHFLVLRIHYGIFQTYFAFSEVYTEAKAKYFEYLHFRQRSSGIFVYNVYT